MTVRHRQSCYNACARYETRSVTATFTDPTTDNNLVVVFAVIGGGSCGVNGPSGFTLIRNVSYGHVQLLAWYMEGAPSMNSVTITINNDRSVQLRAMEFDGVRQSGALDKVAVRTSNSSRCDSGSTGTTAQADQVIVACVASSTSSCSQSGFTGGFTRYYENDSPKYYGRHGFNDDEDRTRHTIHVQIAQITSSFSLQALLSSSRDWAVILITFRGGSTGPRLFTAKLGLSGPALITSCQAVLTSFGPLKASGTVALTQTTGTAHIFPFEYQYLLNGVLTSGVPWIDDYVPYRVVSHDGLYGYGMRTSDDDQPRGDGALRGIDLQSARQVSFEIDITDSPDGIERDLDALYRALIPQRDTDWDLIWRHPGQNPRLIRCRPVDLPRSVDRDGTIVSKQSVQFRAADPRHYSAAAKRVTVPVTPANAANPTTVNVINEGNVAAYPVITVTGPSSGAAVTRVQLVNQTSLNTFDVQLTLQKGSTLIGNMEARITGMPISVITLDGQSKYGSWQLPRDPWRLEADPTGQLGYNVIYLKTEPAGAPITCTLDYRDCWSG